MPRCLVYGPAAVAVCGPLTQGYKELGWVFELGGDGVDSPDEEFDVGVFDLSQSGAPDAARSLKRAAKLRYVFFVGGVPTPDVRGIGVVLSTDLAPAELSEELRRWFDTLPFTGVSGPVDSMRLSVTKTVRSRRGK